MSRLRITRCESVATSTITSTPSAPLELFKSDEYVSDTSEEEEDDDALSRITITSIESLDDEAERPNTSSPPTDLNSLCHALSNISLNPRGEYIEKDDDVKDYVTKIEHSAAINVTTPPVPVRTKPKLPPPGINRLPTEDPLSIPKPERRDAQFSQEQAHNILAPYYRTVDEPWDQQTASDPRVTLAAMFKANSNRFRQDSVARRCSRPGCQYTTDCYWEREWEQRQGRGLYHYTQCI